MGRKTAKACNPRLRTMVLLLFAVSTVVKSQTDTELESTLERIFSPSESSMHAAALRRDLMRRLYEALDRQEMEEGYKRSVNSLARWNNMPTKRNLAALARDGLIRTLPRDSEEDKRSISSLAKTGQLPHMNNEEKRGIESLARNGDFYYRKNLDQMVQDLYDKRNIGSLAKNFNFPSVTKRNVAALLRMDKLHNQDDRAYGENDQDDKRTLKSHQSFKRSVRNKREIDYFPGTDDYVASIPLYPNNNLYEYEDMIKSLEDYPVAEKRFLGSVAKSGWFRQATGNSKIPDKRHIGSLARLGWLPALRTVRRFNRSGRSIDCDREVASDGKTEDDAFVENKIPIKY